MELGIKGHKTRGNEVIKILETLGGVNRYDLIGIYDNCFYHIRDKVIENSYIGPEEIKEYEIFSLEDFLKNFPYKVGDKVNVLVNTGYYGRKELETSEIKSMKWNSARCEIAYRMKSIAGEFYKSDIRGKVNNKENLFHTTNEYEKFVDKTFQGGYEKCKSEMNMNDNNVDLTLNGEIYHGTRISYLIPDGYEISKIENNEIILQKKKPTYPKTSEECCDILKTTYVEWFGYYGEVLVPFQILIICRDAYWKIAGEELGLDKPWKPVWDESEDLYTVHTFNGEIKLSGTSHRNAILVFPTEEMRDMFYENFKELIEQCKELL